MSEKFWKNLRAKGEYPVKDPAPAPIRKSSTRHVSSRRFKNKKHTLGRLKRATHLNNWNNVPFLCPRGTSTPEEYALYCKYKNK